jgi:cytochrome c553
MTTVVRVLAALSLVFVARLLWGSRSRHEDMRASIVRHAVKHPWLTSGAMAAAALVLAAFGVVSGVVPIKASSGHWRITAAFLDFAKTRSVSTHSWGIRAPALDDSSLVLKGAGHYETACLPCHGGPGRDIPPVVAAMTPTPPALDERRLGRWSPEELFVIVKHGIKFTGMPGWPAQQRDDEIWAMVAFLRRLPALDATAYRQLVHGDSLDTELASDGSVDAAPAVVRTLCSRCHAANGTGRGDGAIPSLAGQRSAYVYGSLRAFRERRRFSAMMSEVSARLTDAAMRQAAAYYEQLPSRVPEASDEAAIGRGRSIAEAGIPERDIPACIECHGPTDVPKNPAYPRLTTQHATYLQSQLMLLQERRRGGTPNVDLMHAFVNRLRPSEIRDAAAFYSASSSSAAPRTVAIAFPAPTAPWRAVTSVAFVPWVAR